MTEQKVKKRGWVKNAAIIFLTVMLVLTFFSNTIMNHSLPEVAAQYVQSGSLNSKIRGTGTVSANESYEVKSDQTREVLSVPVKVGDKVQVGDTLILFADAESKQLQEAQDALDALVLAYQKALINASDADYAKENRDIKLAQQALDKAKAERDANTYSAADYASAKANVNRAKTEVTIQQAKVDSLQDQLSGMSPGNDNSSIYAQIKSKQAELTTAQQDLASDQLTYGADYATLTDLANAYKVEYEKSNPSKGNVSVYTKSLVTWFQSQITSSTDPNDDIALPYGSDKVKASAATKMIKAYTEINSDNENIASINNTISELQGQINYGDYNYNTVKNQLKDAKTLLVALQTAQANFETGLKELEEKKTKYEEAVKAVETNQKNLEDLMFALAEKQKTDGKTKASTALDLAAQRTQIERKKQELEKLKVGGEGASVVSKVNGIVATINVSAGKTSQADTALMVIEVPDMGYGISIPVTVEQSKKVKVGDPGEIANYYGSEITATLVGIKSDPQNPGKNKLLSFKLQGEIESGTQLSVSIGERGGSYETIVPNSSVRSDNNGSFVLVIIAKSSPLGNRYVAQRVDVKVLASDDVNSAVSGGLTTSDFVITTSNKPIEPGMQVRMPDQ